MATTLESDSEMIVKRVSVPIGLEELMEGLTKEVILKKPKDIYVFASEYFARLLTMREKGTFRAIPVKRAQSLTKQFRKEASMRKSVVTEKKSKSVDNTATDGKSHTSSTVDDSALKKTLSVRKIGASPPARDNNNLSKVQAGNKSKVFLDKRKARKASIESPNKTGREPSKESPRSVSSDKSSEKKAPPSSVRGARDRSISGNNRKVRAKSEEEKSRTPRQASTSNNKNTVIGNNKMIPQKPDDVVALKKMRKSKSHDVKTGIAEPLIKATAPLIVNEGKKDQDNAPEKIDSDENKIESSHKIDEDDLVNPKSEVEDISQLSPVQESPILATKDTRNDEDNCVGCALKAHGAVDLRSHDENKIEESVAEENVELQKSEEKSEDIYMQNKAEIDSVDGKTEESHNGIKTENLSFLENLENEIVQTENSDERKKRSLDETIDSNDSVKNEQSDRNDKGTKFSTEQEKESNENENNILEESRTSMETINKETLEKEQLLKESSTIDVSDNKTTKEITKSEKNSTKSNVENTEKKTEENMKVHVNDKNQEITTTISTIVEKIEESSTSETVSSEEIIKVTEEILPGEGSEEDQNDIESLVESVDGVDKDGTIQRTNQIEITERSEKSETYEKENSEENKIVISQDGNVRGMNLNLNIDASIQDVSDIADKHESDPKIHEKRKDDFVEIAGSPPKEDTLHKVEGKTELTNQKIEQTTVDNLKDDFIEIASSAPKEDTLHKVEEKTESADQKIEQTVDNLKNDFVEIASSAPKEGSLHRIEEKTKSQDQKIAQTVDNLKKETVEIMEEQKITISDNDVKDSKLDQQELEDRKLDTPRTHSGNTKSMADQAVDKNIQVKDVLDEKISKVQEKLASNSDAKDTKSEQEELEEKKVDSQKADSEKTKSVEEKVDINIPVEDVIDGKVLKDQEKPATDSGTDTKIEQQELEEKKLDAQKTDAEKTKSAEEKVVDENVQIKDVIDDKNSTERQETSVTNKNDEIIVPNKDENETKNVIETEKIDHNEKLEDETSTSENAIAADLPKNTGSAITESKDKSKMPLAENVLKVGIPTAAVAGIVQTVDSKLSGKSEMETKSSKPKESIKIKNTKSRASSHDHLKTKDANDKETKEKTKIKRVKSTDTLSHKTLPRTKSKQKLSSSAQAEDLAESVPTKHQNEKSKVSPRLKSDDKETETKPNKRSRRSASIDAVNKNKEVDAKTLKPQSSFDSSKLKEELKQAEDIGKKSNFKSNFNPLVLRQEIKKASEDSKEGERDKMAVAMGPIAAALKIQSVWRGFLVRRNKSKQNETSTGEAKGVKIEAETFVNKPEEVAASSSQIQAETNSSSVAIVKPNLDVKIENNKNVGEQMEKKISKESKQVEAMNVAKEHPNDHGIDKNDEEPEKMKDNAVAKTIVNTSNIIQEAGKSMIMEELEKVDPEDFRNAEKEATIKKSTSESVGDIVKMDSPTEKEGDKIQADKTNSLESQGEISKEPLSETNIDKTFINDFISFEKSNVFREGGKSDIRQAAKDEKTSLKVEEIKTIPTELPEKMTEVINQNRIINSGSAKSKKSETGIGTKDLSEGEEDKETKADIVHPGGLIKENEATDIKNNLSDKENEKPTGKLEIENDAKEELKIAKAVLKIQALWRGFNVRKLKNRGELFGSTVESDQEKQKEVLRALEKRPKAHSSASRIQAVWRGYKVRKNIKEVNSKLAKMQKPQECDEMPGQRGPTNEDIMKAATKIQAGARGYMARKKINKNGLKSISEESPKRGNNSDEAIVEAIKLLDGVPGHSPDKKRKSGRAKTVEEPQSIQKLTKISSVDSITPRPEILKTNSIDENGQQEQDLEGVIINREENNNMTTVEEEVKEAVRAISASVPEEVEGSPKNTANEKKSQRVNEHHVDDNKKVFTTNPPEFSNVLLRPKTADKELHDGPKINDGRGINSYETAPTRPVTTTDIRRQEDSKVDGNKTESRDANENKRINHTKNAQRSDENKNVNLSVITTGNEKLLNEINDKITKSKLDENGKHKENNPAASENNHGNKDGDVTASDENSTDDEQKRPLSLESTTSRDSAVTVIYNDDSEIDEDNGKLAEESHDSIPWVETEDEVNKGLTENPTGDEKEEPNSKGIDQDSKESVKKEEEDEMKKAIMDSLSKTSEVDEREVTKQKGISDINTEKGAPEPVGESSDKKDPIIDKAAIYDFISFERGNTFRDGGQSRESNFDLSKLRSEIEDAKKIEETVQKEKPSSVKIEEKSVGAIPDLPSLAKPKNISENSLEQSSNSSSIIHDGGKSIKALETGSSKENDLSKDDNVVTEPAGKTENASGTNEKGIAAEIQKSPTQSAEEKETVKLEDAESEHVPQMTDTNISKAISSESIPDILIKTPIENVNTGDLKKIDKDEQSFLDEGLKEKDLNFVRQAKLTPSRDKDVNHSSNEPENPIITKPDNKENMKNNGDKNAKDADSPVREETERKATTPISAISSSEQVKITPKDVEKNGKSSNKKVTIIDETTPNLETTGKDKTEEESRFDLARLRREIEATITIAETFTNSDKLKNTTLMDTRSSNEHNKLNIPHLKEEIEKVDDDFQGATLIDKHEVEKEIEDIDQTIDLVDKEIDEVLQNLKDDTKKEIIPPAVISNSDDFNNKLDREKLSEEIENHVQKLQNRDESRSNAAKIIQSNYRGYRVRRDLTPSKSSDAAKAIGIPLRELSDIKEEDTDLKSSSTGSLEDLQSDPLKDRSKGDEEGLKKIDEHEQEITEKEDQKIQVPAQETVNLMHSGEFHDTVPVPLPVTPPPPTRPPAEGASPDSGRRHFQVEEGHDHVRSVSVQLNDEAPPAGAAVLTSPGSTDGDDHGDGGVGGQRKIAAQASDKDASTCAAQSDNKMPGSSMDSEKRNNNAAAPKKNMEVEAATKIQAGFRGYQVRKQLKNKTGVAAGDFKIQRRSALPRRKSSGRLSDSGLRIAHRHHHHQSIGKQPKSAVSEIEEKSAVKIQAGIRGFLVRRRQKKAKIHPKQIVA